ncbi:uncharacterized protein LOC110249960 [Exaiptasia diaphana]|uniref:Uncharacterized protein n=1 Tax=Exaiptasia diaphana TaxID=2652724 RepID=A0A913XZ50_EXADI|nr:uncharacterized protein LOC110249960 [Exaiptasia diaphana]KXJ23770.1 hypothetical protein AC249_AIPGENE4489 [Exaiptasia diaphana]
MLRVSLLVLGALCLGFSLGGEIKSTKIKVKETDTKNLEQVSINVQTAKIEKDNLGNFKDAEILKVAFQVTVLEGNIHVNGLKAKHDSVTAFHFHAEIVEIGKNSVVLRQHTSPIIIRVLVLEQSIASGRTKTKKLVVEAQIIEIDSKKVSEIDVLQMIVKLDNSKNELIAERKVTAIRIAESKIRTHPAKNDIHVHHQGGRLPHKPLNASKKQMDDFQKLGKPVKPKTPLHADKTSFGGKVDRYEHSICKDFYKLPFAARLSIFLLITFLGLATVFCCVRAFCCKPPAKTQKFTLEEFDEKCDFDGVFDAPPLDTKVPLEKQQLVLQA